MSGVQISNGHDDNSVLIVNDAPEQLVLMQSLLRKAGYSVITAEDGVQGLTLAKQRRPDLVISDVSMPRMNGLSFVNVFGSDSELKFRPHPLNQRSAEGYRKRSCRAASRRRRLSRGTF